jgi:hypothetical protein
MDCAFAWNLPGSGRQSSLARVMSVQAASWLSRNIWRLIAPRLGRQKRALAILELACPEKSLGERKAIAGALAPELAPDRLPAALNGQVPQPRAFRTGFLEIACRRDLLAVDRDDDVSLLHSDSRGG